MVQMLQLFLTLLRDNSLRNLMRSNDKRILRSYSKIIANITNCRMYIVELFNICIINKVSYSFVSQTRFVCVTIKLMSECIAFVTFNISYAAGLKSFSRANQIYKTYNPAATHFVSLY